MDEMANLFEDKGNEEREKREKGREGLNVIDGSNIREAMAGSRGDRNDYLSGRVLFREALHLCWINFSIILC